MQINAKGSSITNFHSHGGEEKVQNFRKCASLAITNAANKMFTQGPGIGVPFNVQHVAHIGADNVEALLLAAKDDPKLLPSFLLPEALGDEKEDRKKSVGKDDTKAGELIS